VSNTVQPRGCGELCSCNPLRRLSVLSRRQPHQSKFGIVPVFWRNYFGSGSVFKDRLA
jgi:hypothetical protein